MPWCSAEFRRDLPYIRNDTLLLVPVAHCLLRGVQRALLLLALTTLAAEAGKDHEVTLHTVVTRFSFLIVLVYSKPDSLGTATTASHTSCFKVARSVQHRPGV
jgi:hypothetical protein